MELGPPQLDHEREQQDRKDLGEGGRGRAVHKHDVTRGEMHHDRYYVSVVSTLEMPRSPLM